ncbi:hypothetical protein [Bacteroides acidifaciens]|uniref:hypothetical protein n=1 Tax=Bacteroides acidifaciens TaxID=85831 RepID=UPI003F692594
MLKTLPIDVYSDLQFDDLWKFTFTTNASLLKPIKTTVLAQFGLQENKTHATIISQTKIPDMDILQQVMKHQKPKTAEERELGFSRNNFGRLRY